MSEKKFYRTVISIEVLAEYEYNPESLLEVHFDITNGDCSGQWDVISRNEETVESMAQMLLSQGSDPGFFRIFKDENGNWVYDEDRDREYNEEEDDSESA